MANEIGQVRFPRLVCPARGSRLACSRARRKDAATQVVFRGCRLSYRDCRHSQWLEVGHVSMVRHWLAVKRFKANWDPAVCVCVLWTCS